MDVLTAAGLGLDYGTVRLARASEEWLAAGSVLRDQTAIVLGELVAGVEHVGSSSVPGLLAKPIVDLAVGCGPDQVLDPITSRLETAGWIYLGDTGDEGGHLFVLESRPWHRIAHLHVVDHGGWQWRNYLRFRNLLRTSAEARQRYEAVKQDLALHHRDDRPAYTAGKTGVVTSLLAQV